MKKTLNTVLLILLILILLAGLALLCGRRYLAPAPQPTPEPTPFSAPVVTPGPTPEPTTLPTPEPTPLPTPSPVPDYPAEQLAVSIGGADETAARALLDEVYQSDYTFPAGTRLTLTADREIGSVYIRFGTYPGEWTLLSGEREFLCGQDGFLHEFVPINGNSSSVEIVLSEEHEVMIRDVFVFSNGYTPDFVQTWLPPEEPADILLFVAHYDDELLFMGGMIPYYAAVEGRNVQVVYMTSNYLTDFSDYRYRPHEALNGLWECGVRHYPITNEAPDYIGQDLDTLWQAQQQYGEDAFFELQTELIRRFKPLVVVTQAEDGEYGHGAHILTALSVERAVEAAADPDVFPESAARYGVWDTPKTYVHKYGDPGAITVLDYEQPSDALGGRSPIDTARDAYRLHLTQQRWVGFYVCDFGHPQDSHRYGLFRTLVGPDEARNDLMEHVSREDFPAE